MKIVRNPLLPPKDFLAINLFGFCFCRRDAVITKRVVNHESIHTAQMRELLYVGFYVLYVAEWLYRLLLIRSSYDAYMAISFEREASRWRRFLPKAKKAFRLDEIPSWMLIKS